MEFLRRIIGQIKTQLGGLTLSQKYVFILSVILMAGLIWMMVNYSARRELVPLLNQDFSEAELSTIANKLDSWNEPYNIKGGKIYVQKSKQQTLIAKLGYAEVLPRDTSIGWGELLENSDIWTPESVRQDKKLIVLQMMLANAIENGWPEVEKAEVFINKGSKRVISNIQPVASASVSVQLVPGTSPSSKLAQSIAAFVSSANNTMKRESVKVIADGKLLPITPEGDEISGDYIAMKTQFEQHCREKILSVLPVQNALVQVDVTLETTSTVVQETHYAPDGEGSWNAVVEETSLEDTSENADTPAEPGLIANAAEKPSAAAGSSQKSASEQSSKTNKAFAGSTSTARKTPRGGIRDITATVMIPTTYFELIAKQGSEKTPTPEQVEAIKKIHIPKIKKAVMAAIGMFKSEDESRVVVEDYWAEGILANGAAGTSGIAGSAGGGNEPAAASFSGIAQRYGKHIAVSALAFISLFMVLMMVKKAAQPVNIKENKDTMMVGNTPVDALSFEDSNIATGEEDGLLAGLELGEEAMRTQQVLGQIRQMVNEDPDSASKLISRWMQDD